MVNMHPQRFCSIIEHTKQTSNPGLHIPLELIEPIIKHAGRYSAQDLQSLSLVSKIWTPIAQPLLFSSVVIHTDFIHTSPALFGDTDEYEVRTQLGGVPDPLFFTTGTPGQFRRLLEIAPHIPQYTRHLKFGPTYSRCSYILKNPLAAEVQSVVSSYLPMCTKLESLRFELCDWDALQGIQEPLFAVLKGSRRLMYLSLTCITLPDIVSLVELLESCASLETLVLHDVTFDPQVLLNASVSTPLPSRMKASRRLSLRWFVIFSKSLTPFRMLLDALSASSSPVDIFHVRGFSLVSPMFQPLLNRLEAADSTLSILRNLQRNTLEHLSLPVAIPLVELSSYNLTERLKSLRVSSLFLPACISWLTRTLECGSFPNLTTITIDIHVGGANALILDDEDDWRTFGAVLRNTTHVEIVRLSADNYTDYPSEEYFEALLAGEESRSVLDLLSASEG